MKRYKFEIELTEQDLEGDEFWEDALEEDNTGITAVTNLLIDALKDAHILEMADKAAPEILTLVSYTSK